jgi:Uma2 family endonuclease
MDWSTFEAFLVARGDSGPRFTFLDGVLELMSPSFNHELIAANLGRLLELWSLEYDVELNGLGSLTLKKSRRRAGVEPDRCYFVGPVGARTTPDLAIEVVWSAPLLDKLEAYRRLGVREVWVWAEGHLVPWVLGSGGYVRGKKSRVLPELELAQLAKYATRVDQHAAVKAYRTALRRN